MYYTTSGANIEINNGKVIHQNFSTSRESDKTSFKPLLEADQPSVTSTQEITVSQNQSYAWTEEGIPGQNLDQT